MHNGKIWIRIFTLLLAITLAILIMAFTKSVFPMAAEIIILVLMLIMMMASPS